MQGPADPEHISPISLSLLAHTRYSLSSRYGSYAGSNTFSFMSRCIVAVGWKCHARNISAKGG